jgi:hypothetical protein
MFERKVTYAAAVLLCLLMIAPIASEAAGSATAPAPLLASGKTVDWWFVFKFNATAFPSCGGTVQRACLFGGEPQKYKFGQQFAFASSAAPALQMGSGCAGDTITDPLGATFGQVYNGSYFYAVWNDQFKGDPMKDKDAPWGHSKGLLAWDTAGDGFVLQVTTPSWPGAGNKGSPRKDGNTLGCMKDDDVEASQHFFALKLNKADLLLVLKALENASVVTDPKNLQIVKNGGPEDVQAAVSALGVESKAKTVLTATLSSGVKVISKPSGLHVPPWQMVSASLDGVGLRAATWWDAPFIYTTTVSTTIGCWDKSLSKPGAVQIATSGQFNSKTFGLQGGPTFNHAKIGVSTTAGQTLSIFGDMNQQGDSTGNDCASSQNARGGLFYVMKDPTLFKGVSSLIQGTTGPTKAPAK